MLTAINVQSFLQSLPLMGQGMLGIFLVTVVLIGCVYALNHLTGKKK